MYCTPHMIKHHTFLVALFLLKACSKQSVYWSNPVVMMVHTGRIIIKLIEPPLVVGLTFSKFSRYTKCNGKNTFVFKLSRYWNLCKLLNVLQYKSVENVKENEFLSYCLGSMKKRCNSWFFECVWNKTWASRNCVEKLTMYSS